MTFRALLLTQNDGATQAQVADLDEDQLPAEGDVLVAVEYSTVNYKDGLAITGRAPVVRKWPMVAGIDGAGTVLASSHPRWKAGDKVVLNGYGVGETHWGCLSQRARLKGDWLVALPDGFSTRDAMAIGTAGYTAMLSVLALERAGLTPDDGEVLVTGASGGVGSVAIALLGKLGYRVVASTGKTAEADFLKALGAAEIIDRNTLSSPGKPLQKERFAAVVDSVGSHTLVNACAQVRYGGLITACGLAQGMDFPANMAPFILRGVTLLGIDSVMAPMARREQAWQRLAQDLAPDRLAALTSEIGLGDAIAAGQRIMEGGVRGRVVVDVNR
ncbi:MDR family oxidoreductase [Cupriavidus sp. AU9028]|uniref:acrylyl-CoA reductase (NADPH) n=1 Tax=Cupriavidus sp. AU9028 TaxID=2871157 RepID=UPI001C97D91F|nr:MDR family oxidoreductase [Cupriavidus sp. AU9028]MBY4898264.1 oxidoreductase [Cupriavidus sp. AU9028]